MAEMETAQVETLEALVEEVKLLQPIEAGNQTFDFVRMSFLLLKHSDDFGFHNSCAKVSFFDTSPICYCMHDACGAVVSAALSRLPVRSDCAFTQQRAAAGAPCPVVTPSANRRLGSALSSMFSFQGAKARRFRRNCIRRQIERQEDKTKEAEPWQRWRRPRLKPWKPW